MVGLALLAAQVLVDDRVAGPRRVAATRRVPGAVPHPVVLEGLRPAVDLSEVRHATRLPPHVLGEVGAPVPGSPAARAAGNRAVKLAAVEVAVADHVIVGGVVLLGGSDLRDPVSGGARG